MEHLLFGMIHLLSLSGETHCQIHFTDALLSFHGNYFPLMYYDVIPPSVVHFWGEFSFIAK
jgi:hypothetical protein